MEAVPKLPLISFELKTSPENTHFGPKLKQYISEAYREDPESYSNEIHQLEGLRSAAVRPSLDTTGLSALLRYFCQLRAIQSRFPMAKGQPVACSFAWKDLYANMSCSLADIRFEMACILYNIGALYTQLAASEPRTSVDSLKAACTKYQNAAWAFQSLREQYPQPAGVDVSTDIMRLFQEICFAQAQECILDKSIQDTKKPSVVGAVAIQVLLFYRNSLALLGPSTGTDNIHEIIGTKLYNYWHRYLSFKAAYIGCIVCLYQGMNAEEQQKMGERVAYYQQAADKLNEARKLAKYIEPTQITQEALNFTNDVVEGKKKAAKNENEFIYHEEVPDKDLLVDLKPVCLVKSIAIDLNDTEISGPDIFSRLVPMEAHEASSMYSEVKAKLLRHVVSQVEVKNTELMEFMSSLQLDQLDVLDSDQKIPQEIVDRCAAMNAKTEIIQTLVDSMNNLAEIISDVEHTLADIKNLIQEETEKEKEYQKVIGPRPPSIVQTELSREYHKYQEAHARTNESNQVLHKAMTLHIANLRLLAQPLDVLQAKIPSIDNIEGLDRTTMSELRRVVGKAREMQAQREALVQELREAITADDITAKLLASSEPADEMFRRELEKHTPKVKIIEQNLAAQENIINKLTSLYASYGDSRRLLSDVLRKREGLINALITSYDTYSELVGKSHKGQEFYRRLAHSAAQLLQRARATVQVLSEERHQLLRAAAANTAAATAGNNATAAGKAAVPTTSTAVKSLDSVPPPSTGGSRKLKDYLPYMKNRNAPRSVTPQAQVDPAAADAYYPETIYPTSVRPTPVGSEATDLSQMKVPDGVVMPQVQNFNAYNRYNTPYASNESEPYIVPSNYNYAMTGKPYEKSEDNYYSTPYTPPQYSTQVTDPQIYTNPYYSATHNNTTMMTDSQISNPYAPSGQATVDPITGQYNIYSDPYGAGQTPVSPESVPHNAANPNDMNVNFAQMQISYPKQESTPQPNPNYGADYSQTYYSVQYPQAATPNNATYSHAIQNSNTNMTPSQIPTDYSSLNYPYSGDTYNQQQVQPVQPAEPVPPVVYSSSAEYSYATGAYTNMPQGYTIYTNADSAMTSTTSVSNPAVGVAQYPYQEPDPAVLSQLDAYDKPIKSHVTGEALSNVSFQTPYRSFDQNASSYPNQNIPDQNAQPSTPYSYPDRSVNFVQTYQNHPGYTYNQATGSYDYAYGSQNSCSTSYSVEQPSMVNQTISKDPNLPTHGMYTNAGSCETVQSPSEMTENMLPQQIGVDQTYYNAPYGYQSTDQSNVSTVSSQPVSTNYGASVNQSTYMLSGQGHDTSVTYANDQGKGS
ncbi:unnamed protein product [Diatraea saccharalis]|uniref:BRO1 domain-containing protein n=1 Tax=Diatraea saccharalis TaxID=40085 RepID=A0A9P0C306_9NEOP|nr:unnamed protein product [Diatraea saccharalis]